MTNEDLELTVSKELRKLAIELIRTCPYELGHIDVQDVLFLMETSGLPYKDAGECRLIKHPYQQLLAKNGRPYLFMVVVYSWWTEDRTPEHLKLLLYHELRHIGENKNGEPVLIKHTAEDFRDIYARFGINWDYTNKLPDIMGLLKQYDQALEDIYEEQTEL